MTGWGFEPQKRYVLSNATLVNPTSGDVQEGATVFIKDGVFLDVILKQDKEVGGTPQLIGSEGAELETIEVDLGGRYLCPGLIDCHVHMNAVPGEKGLRDMKLLNQETISYRQTVLCRQMIERGFTTARDCGGSSASLKQAVAQGWISGPRLFIAGHQLTQTGGHGDIRLASDTTECCGGHVFGSGRLCDGVPECLRVSRDELRRGADFLKIMGGGGISSPTDSIESVQFDPEEVRAIVSVAQRNHTYVTCHAYTPESIRNAIDNGVTGIEHGNLMDVDTARLMAEKGIFLTPTLVTYSVMNQEEYRSFLPVEAIQKNEQVLQAGLESLKIADEAGITMLFGSDLLGPMCHLQTNEFSLRAKAISAAKLLQAATVNGAKRLQQETHLGQIKAGFAADALILNSNPLQDITILDNPEKHLLAVFKDGRVHVSRWSKLCVDVNAPKPPIE